MLSAPFAGGAPRCGNADSPITGFAIQTTSFTIEIIFTGTPWPVNSWLILPSIAIVPPSRIQARCVAPSG